MNREIQTESIGGVTIKFHKSKGPGRRLCPGCQAAGQQYCYVGATYHQCPRCGHHFAAKGKAAPPHEPSLVDQHNAAIVKQMVGSKPSPEGKPEPEPESDWKPQDRVPLSEIFGFGSRSFVGEEELALGAWLDHFPDIQSAVDRLAGIADQYELMQKHFSN